MIYEPAEDSILLKRYVGRYAKGKVLDMGCGSGVLAEEALKKTHDVLAADISIEAVEFCKKKGIRAVQSDLFRNIGGRFDLIVFNPPYLPEDKREDEGSRASTTGGTKGHETLERFLREAKKHLGKNGKILIIVSSLTGDVHKLFRKHGYNFRLLESKKLFFETLFIYLLC